MAGGALSEPRDAPRPRAGAREDALRWGLVLRRVLASNLVAGLVLAAGVFAVYAAGACRSIYVGDSGELVTAVHLLGIPHPSGYPLYVLLGKIWTLLVPLGTIAYRMSLFSAVSAAAACGALFGLARRMGARPTAAASAALLLAFSPSLWAEANVQRVYALNALFVVLATTAAWSWFATRSPGSLALAFFLCGLGASNHTFMVFFAAALALFAIVAGRGGPEGSGGWRWHAACAGAFVIGLLPYVYLPLRSRANPRLDWGNPETLGAFLDVVLRRDFWNRRWIESPADLLPITANYLDGVRMEIGWTGVALASIGVLAGLAWMRGRTFAGRMHPGGPDGALSRTGRFVLGLPLLVMVANLAAVALHGSRTDIFIWHRYDIPSYVMAALLAGIGCHAVLAGLPGPARALPLLLPLAFLVGGWREHDRSRYRIGEDFSMAVLDAVPPGAHLIAEDDNILFTLMYLHLVEHRRPDVDLILQGVGKEVLPPLRFDPDTDPLFFTHHPNWELPELSIVPMGVVLRAWRAGTPAPPPRIAKLQLEGENDPRVPKDYLTRNLIGHFHFMLGTTFETSDWPRAQREFRAATAASPDNDVLFFNLGLIYRRNGLFQDARTAFERSRAINPRHIANRRRPLAGDRIEEVAAEAARLEKLEARLTAADPVARTIPRGVPEYHLRLAALLEASGEHEAARGHRLRAQDEDALP